MALRSRLISRLIVGLLFGTTVVRATSAVAQRQMENLGRGMVAIHQGGGKVYVGWRMLGTDPDDIAFNVYRAAGGGEAVKLNDRPLTQSTNYVDRGVDLGRSHSYFVKPVRSGKEGAASAPFTLPAGAPAQPYLSIALRTPEGCTPNDASVGDLDGDGEYEIVLHQAPRGRDNAQGGTTGEPILEAYELDGTLLWRIRLGKNIREGAHYTQFMVYDLDGDGKAEFACKTADGTVDGQGKVIGDGEADYRNPRGYVLEGPELLTVFDGRTGAELVTTDYIPPRGNVRDWGDDYGNRVDRFLACVAYLDGQRPSLVMCRGYYTRAVLAAWNFSDGTLRHVWTFDSDDGTAGNRAYRGQGNHNLSVGDVDGDGKDEIVYGACAIDHDGTGLYSTGLGHGDAMHLSDIDPDRPGLEVFAIHERPRHPHGANLRDAATGEVIWGLPLGDPGRGLSMDVDPRHPGYECWANSSDGLYNCKGEKISDSKPRSCNMGIWWDGDLLREILDGSSPRRWGGGRGGAFIDKWDYTHGTTTRLLDAGDYGCLTNNGTKANPCLHADILGDWREEVIWRTTDGTELRIFTTTIPADRRQYTLMHDPVYRLSVAWQNVAYNQPTQPGFYMGEGMEAPPRPNIKVVGNQLARRGERLSHQRDRHQLERRSDLRDRRFPIGGTRTRASEWAGRLVHDPSTIVKCKDEYWLFATGRGIVSRRSKDLVQWRTGPRVFSNPPAWTAKAVPANRGHYWAPDSPIYSLAYHKSIEAPFIHYRQGCYYLFVNWGLCARGVHSTYNIRVGRSARVTGPYLDKDGVDMLRDGGSLLLGTVGKFIGPGHAGILSEGDQDWLSYHYYDGSHRRGIPTLAVRRLDWDTDGWPELREPMESVK